MAVSVFAHAEGSILAVRAQPNAKKNAVVGEQGGSLKVAVTAPPEDGRANTAIIEVLREWLGVKRSQIELIAGATNREKKVLVRAFSVEELEAKIADQLGQM